MSAITTTKPAVPFVAGLRVRPRSIDMSRVGDASINVRVEMAEVWDAVRIVASPAEPVVTIKRAALEALYPDGELPDEFVIKLRGWEVLDESTSLRDAGAIDGSIFLMTHRRRRPVK